MNIVQRNFFRLIRCGAFNKQEQIEPMSACKWNKLHQLAVMHNVTESVYHGLELTKDQFFVHLTDKQWEQWAKTMNELNQQPQKEEDDDEFLRADHLTNPVLNSKLQSILDDEKSDTSTRQALLLIIRIARHILNEGVPVRQLIELGSYLRSRQRIDFVTLQKWLKSLSLLQTAQLEGALLIQMFDFDQEEIPFMQGKVDKHAEDVAQELVEFTNTRAQDFYFSQESGSVFIHTSNGSAMLGHIKRSARYFRYLPSETLTNFFASFAHSLSHIEE